MARFDFLFQNADIITVDDANPVIRNGFVGVKDGGIAYVGASMPNPSDTAHAVDCTKRILMPGLVNAHAHAAMCLLRGYADDYALEDWLFKRVFPAEARLDKRAILAGARLGFAEMLRFGVTSVTDMYFHIPETAKLASEIGIRANLSNGIVALHGFDPDTDRAVAETRALATDLKRAADGLVRVDAAIHAEYTSGPRAWEYAVELAQEYGLNLHLHLSETRREHEACIARHGMTPAALLERHGVFSRRVLAAHCVHVSGADMDLIASHGASVAHCPVSNLKLASGIARVAEMKRRGVNVALGTDGCCSNNTHDLFEEMKLAALLAKGVSGDPTLIPAREAIRMATANGAYAQGREHEIGRIAPGYRADLILIDADAPSVMPVHDVESAAVYAARGSDVRLTMVNGRVLYQDGQFMTIDMEKAKAEVRDYALPLALGGNA